MKKQFFWDLSRHDIPGCAAALNSRPLLVIYGTADELVPVEDARVIHGAATEPKQLALIRGGDHRFTLHIDRVWDEFFRWLQLYAPPFQR